MTTNVPQDVKDFIRDICEMPEPVTLRRTLLVDLDWFEGKLTELLRAQRQQGVEPVAYLDYNGVLKPTRHGVITMKKGDQLYATPPQANALVAAAYRDAAELEETCQLCGGSGDVEYLSNGAPDCYLEVGPCHKCNGTGAIPADAEAALREVCMKVARKASGCGWSLGMESASPKESDLQAIVNSVLGESGK
jgi:hypothetical protein